MAYNHPDWIAHQCQRWLRPDWQRFVRPDAERWIRPDAHRFAPPGTPRYHGRDVARYFWPHHPLDRPDQKSERTDSPDCVDHRDLAFEREVAVAQRALQRIRADVAEVAADFKLRRLLSDQRTEYGSDCKAGFRWDQPRWPRNSGDRGGQWSGGSGTARSEGASDRGPSRGGHHFVSQEVYKDLPLRPETRKVFEQAVTGPLNAGSHGWSKEHAIYNDAVAEHFERFMEKHGVTVEQLVPDQAQKFVDEIKRTNDPRIRTLNMKIYMREIMYGLRRGPRKEE